MNREPIVGDIITTFDPEFGEPVGHLQYIIYKTTWKYLHCWAYNHERAHELIAQKNEVVSAHRPLKSDVLKNKDDRVRAIVAPELIAIEQKHKQLIEEREQTQQSIDDMERKKRDLAAQIDLVACRIIDLRLTTALD